MAEDAGTLTLNVVTPEGALYKGAAAFVAVPAIDGELGILPGHAALIAQLGTGCLRIRTAAGGEEETTLTYVVRGGFLQVVADHVTLLATQAVTAEDVDAEALAAELEEILEELVHPGTDDEFAELLDRRRWVEARQALAE